MCKYPKFQSNCYTVHDEACTKNLHPARTRDFELVNMYFVDIRIHQGCSMFLNNTTRILVLEIAFCAVSRLFKSLIIAVQIVASIRKYILITMDFLF